MYALVKILVAIVVCSVALILGSNISGFFTELSDAPPFETPAELAAGGEAAGGGAAGGPGKGIYTANCSSCHQGSGKGLPGVYPPLAGSAVAQGDAGIPIRIVLDGFAGAIEREGQSFNGVMAPHRDMLDDKQIADVLTYVRSAFGNAADPVDAELVKSVREETEMRGKPWTDAELSGL